MLCQVALGEYRDVEVSTSSGEDEEGEHYRVRFTEPNEGGRVRAAWVLIWLLRWLLLLRRATAPDEGFSACPHPLLLQGSGGQQWWPAQGYNLQRALAAAHKRTLLLPGDL